MWGAFDVVVAVAGLLILQPTYKLFRASTHSYMYPNFHMRNSRMSF